MALMPIQELARRSGVAASALRFYEEQGLLSAARTSGGRRAYERSTLRRVAFIRAAQTLGLSLSQVKAVLALLPDGRTPTHEDWAQVSRAWRPMIEARIAELQTLRDALDACIGCGCLSLSTCHIFNPGDGAKAKGSGARYLLGDRPGSTAPIAND